MDCRSKNYPERDSMRGFHCLKRLLFFVFFTSLFVFTPLHAGPSYAGAVQPELKFAVTNMVGSDPSAMKYRQLADYLAGKTGMKTVFISGLLYTQIDGLFKAGQVDVAFLCNAHYARRKKDLGFQPLVAPVMSGYDRPKFQVYVIVNKDSKYKSIEDLRGKSVDLSDPLCSTRIYAEYLLLQRHETLSSFFRRVIYSGNVDMTIHLVANRLIEAGFVEGHIWDMEDRIEPVFVSRTKIIHRSQEFTIPPLVVSSSLPGTLRQKIKKLLLGMHADAEGRKVLDALHIKRFVQAEEKDYDDILKMYNDVKGRI